MLRERIASQSEVIRAIVSGYSQCCGPRTERDARCLGPKQAATASCLGSERAAACLVGAERAETFCWCGHAAGTQLNLGKLGLRTARERRCLSRKAVETQGKGSVLPARPARLLHAREMMQ